MGETSPPDRPLFLPKFGLFLQDLRKARKPGWGTKQVAKIARGDGYRHITPNRLFLVEAGSVSDVSPEFLHEIALFYGVSYEAVAIPLVAEKYGLGNRIDIFVAPSAAQAGATNNNPESDPGDAEVAAMAHSNPPPQEPLKKVEEVRAADDGVEFRAQTKPKDEPSDTGTGAGQGSSEQTESGMSGDPQVDKLVSVFKGLPAADRRAVWRFVLEKELARTRVSRGRPGERKKRSA